MMRLTSSLVLEDRYVKERFVRATGPGGQNMNQDATAVELRLNIKRSSLPPDVQDRLIALAGRHVTTGGVLIVDSRAYRSQLENREAAHARLLALLQRAAKEPKVRKPTRPRKAVREGRVAEKRVVGAVKRSRHKGED